MPSITEEVRTKRAAGSGKETMRALVFRGPNQIGIEEAPIPRPRPSPKRRVKPGKVEPLPT